MILKCGDTVRVLVLRPHIVRGKPPAPDLPSRLPLHTSASGRFSFGLRLGFDEPPLPKDLKLSLERAELLDQMLMGKPPSGWEQTDKADLAKAIWGIFSENIAPDLAKKLTSGLQTKSAPGRSYELDLVLITDFSTDVGGGVQFTVRW